MGKSVITRVVAVAGGRFAPGHLGELTQQVPFEMVGAVLAETCRLQRRVRVLPARVVVYLLLAGCLFAELGYRQVWGKLTAGLEGAAGRGPGRVRDDPGPPAAGTRAAACAVLLAARPVASGLAMAGPAGLCDRRHDHDRRRQRGEPGRLLQAERRRHRRVQLSAAAAAGPGGLRHPHRHRRRLRVLPGRRDQLRRGPDPQPARRDAAARRPELRLRPLARDIAAAEADFLIRVRTGNSAPKLPVLRRLPDGSWLSVFGGVPVRVIDASWTITTSTGRLTSDCRLVTTLTDATRFPAPDLAVLYHERREIETTYLELKSTLPGGRVLRARTPSGIEQEIWALPVTYQALRTAIADAAPAVPGTDPDRASFTIALNTARGQVIPAAGVIAGTSIDLAGRIGSRVLASLMPARRLRITPRVVKRAISKYNTRGQIDRTTYKATIDIAILSTESASGAEP